MPTYSIKAPDGRTYRITGPVGATQEQIQAEVLRQHPNASGRGGPDNRPKSFWEGVKEGFHPVAQNFDRIASNINPLMLAADALGLVDTAGTRKKVDARFQQNQASASSRGSTLGKIAGGVVGTLPTLIVPGGPVLQGALGGALMNEDGTLKGVARDAVIGGVGGKAGGMFGKRVVAPVAERVGRTAPARAVSKAVVNATNKLLPGNVSQLPLPRFTPTDKAVNRMAPDVAAARQVAADAARLKLPVALADVDPRLQQLAGSVARHAPDARALAENALNPRALGQADRAVGAIDRHLAPVTNIEARAADIKKAAQAASKPFYDEARAMEAPADDVLSSMLRTPAGQAALKKAYEIAQNEGRDPAKIGFVLDDFGNVSLRGVQANEAGRFTSVANPNPIEELTKTTVRGINGPVSKRGPIDLVGWTRLNGGLADQGGELSHMGLNNAARKMDFAGQEQRFGPLVHDKGMNIDDAAMRAWEAGYFPHLSERPSANEFLDAIRGTHEGWNRHFLPDDAAELARFSDAQEMHHAMQQSRFATGKGLLTDTSVPAGPRPFAPDDAYREIKIESPTFETLQLTKRGLDSQVEKYRNPISRVLDLESDPAAQALNNLRGRFNARLGELNEPYRLGNQAYASEIARRDALRLGFNELPRNAIPRRQFDAGLATLNDKTMPEAQRGFATSMADTVDKARFSGNPYQSVYGSPLQQEKVAGLFPEGAADFGRIADLESIMAQTRTKALGGSQTQANKAADDLFQNDAANMAVDGALQAVTGGGVPGATKLAGMFGRKVLGSRDLGVLGAEKKANAIAPMLFDTSNPAAIIDFLDELARKRLEQEVRRNAYQNVSSTLGRSLGAVPAVAIGGSLAQ